MINFSSSFYFTNKLTNCKLSWRRHARSKDGLSTIIKSPRHRVTVHAHSMVCTLHGMHTPWYAHSMACTLHGILTPWYTHSMVCTLHGMYTSCHAHSMPRLLHGMLTPVHAHSMVRTLHPLHAHSMACYSMVCTLHGVHTSFHKHYAHSMACILHADM